MTLDIDFFSGLYNRHSCYADRLSDAQLESIHVPTPLEDTIRKWLGKGRDIVLVGNPGDGKTHLLMRLKDSIAKSNADIVLDATAEPDYTSIAKRWALAKRKNRPFCLAINQGPLHQLLNDKDNTFDRLKEVKEQCSHLLSYDETRPAPKEVFVVDLNLRSVLSQSIIEYALDNLLRDNVYADSVSYFGDETTDGGMNRKALSNPQVRARLVRLLMAAGHSGMHITMRDLQGFLSYLLFGGRRKADFSAPSSDFHWRYFNLCFDGEGTLFDAVRLVFDPIRATVPAVDEHLWENTGVHDGWLFTRPPLTPDHYPDAWDQFVWLKRQYYFEHTDGEQLLAATGNSESEFFNILQSQGSVERHIPRVVQAINRFFCPTGDDDADSLRLWVSQHYDCHPSRVSVSCYRVPSDRFSLHLPSLASWLSSAMDYQPDHLLLRYHKAGAGGKAVGLRIDRGFWKALMLAGQGVPANLRSPQYAQALMTFLRKLHRLEANPKDRETLLLYNHLTHERISVLVDRKKKIYVARP